MASNTVLLSVIMVAGPCRERGQVVIDALCAQTIVDSIEIIIIDTASEAKKPFLVKTGVRSIYIRHPANDSWGPARAKGVRQATAPIVAFIEDHCVPESNWAEAVIDAHKGSWAAVGYGFTNGSPNTYIFRASFYSDYALWANPIKSGASALLPGNNVAYKRSLLLELGEQLETALNVDYNLQEIFSKREFPMYVESRALAAHQSYSRISDLLKSNHSYARLMGFNRANIHSWGTFKRIFYGLVVPLAVPPLRMARLLSRLRGRSSLWLPIFSCSPIILLAYFSAALGESLGYLFGAGSSGRDFNYWELQAPRVMK